MTISAFAPPYPGTGKKTNHREQALQLYRSLLSAPVVEGEFQFYDIMIPGKQRSGKSYTEAKVTEDSINWHQKEQMRNEIAIYVNRRFSVLSNQVLPALESGKKLIYLIWDDPINEESFSRWGTSRKKGAAVMNFMEIAHQEMLGESGMEHKTAVVYLIHGPQDLGIFERVYREPSMVLVKSPNMGTKEAVLKLLNNRWDIYEQLWENYLGYTYKQEWEKKAWCALVAGPYVEMVNLPAPQTLYCERGSPWWVHDEAELGAPTIDLESMVEELINWAKFKLPYKSINRDIRKHVFDSAKAFLLKKYRQLFTGLNKTTGVYEIKQKSLEDTADQLRSMVLDAKNRVLLLEQQAETNGNINGTEDNGTSPLYEPVLEAIRNDRGTFKNATSKNNAITVLSAYMGHWKANARLQAAERTHPTQEQIADETGLSQKAVSDATGRAKKLLANGRLIEKIVTERLQQKKAREGEVFAREGDHDTELNVHEPDILSNRGRVYGVKFKFGNPRTSKGRTASFDIDSAKGFRPEMDACIKGTVSTERFGNGRETIKVEETFTVVFAALGWDDTLFLLKVDPAEDKVVKFRWDTLEGWAE